MAGCKPLQALEMESCFVGFVLRFYSEFSPQGLPTVVFGQQWPDVTSTAHHSPTWAATTSPNSHPSALFPSFSAFSRPNPAQVLHPKPQLPKEPCHSQEEEAGEMSSELWLTRRFLSLSFPFREFITLSDGWNGLKKEEDGHRSLD